MVKIWAEKPEILRAFGIGRRMLQEWRQKGFVRVAKLNERKIVYRVADVEKTLMLIAEGRTPKRII